MNKIIRKLVENIQSPDIDLKKNYKAVRMIQKAARAPKLKQLYKFWDYKVNVKGYDVPVRIFEPDRNFKNVIIYFHGGGWVIGDIDSYTKVCHNLANETKSLVLSVDYRLAPEYKFPVGLNDCYQVVKEIIKNVRIFNVTKDKIVLMGDSAGANIAAAVSLRRRDRLLKMPYKQILVYPATLALHEIDTFPSIKKYQKNITLSLKQLNDYIDLYKKSDADLRNPYMAPLLAYNFRRQPKTLIITAELDILRDEGEEYGKKLIKAGNDVTIKRISDVGHGFFSNSNGRKVKEVYKIINDFLSE